MDNWPSDDSGEIQIGYIPGLMHDEAYRELGGVFKGQWLGSVGHPRDSTNFNGANLNQGRLNQRQFQTNFKF